MVTSFRSNFTPYRWNQLVILKMENILRAATDGRVAKVLATAGNGVEVDQPILEFEA